MCDIEREVAPRDALPNRTYALHNRKAYMVPWLAVVAGVRWVGACAHHDGTGFCGKMSNCNNPDIGHRCVRHAHEKCIDGLATS